MDNESQLVSLEAAATQFLSCKTIAVFGISQGNDDTAKSIYEKFAESGYTVFGMHPKVKLVKGIRCYSDLRSTPEPVDAAVVVTRPEHVSGIIRQAKLTGTKWLWLHKSFGNSVDPLAVTVGREQGVNIIDGACPMMFLAPVDGAHRCMKSILQFFGRIPKQIPLVEVT